MSPSLFEAERVRLLAPDPDKDAEVEAGWTNDAEYLRLIDPAPARPLSAEAVKKKYEKLEKAENKEFYFAVRTVADDRLIGFAHLFWVDLQHGAAMLNLGLGQPADRGQGYGSEVMRLLLDYAFEELNMHRVSARTASYNTAAIRFLEKHGFVEEVRNREAVWRDGQRWDGLIYGLLKSERKP
jgi:RimJ/RimL family protein N-acetyltransferase